MSPNLVFPNVPLVRTLLPVEEREYLPPNYTSLRGTIEDQISQVENRIRKNRNLIATKANDIKQDIQLLDELNSQFVTMMTKAAELPLESNYEIEYLKNSEKELAESELKDISGIGDRLVIQVGIKIPGYKPYHLDAQIDIGAIRSCYKYKEIPSYYWQPTQIQFRAVNQQIVKIYFVALDFPILLNNLVTYVTLYNYDSGVDILLG